MLRRFGLGILLVAALGLTLAVWADEADGDRDAWREVGGAVVSGAVLAALVVWFEDRREDEREQLAERRSDAAAQAAWRREIDIRLVGVVRTDLSAGRTAWLEMLELETEPSNSFFPNIVANDGRPFSNTISEVSALLAFLRDQALNDAWNRWDLAADAHTDVTPPAPEPPKEAKRAGGALAQFNIEIPDLDLHSRLDPPERDLKLHTITAENEARAWDAFIDGIDVYIEKRYPVV